MTSLRERLERKIESEADELFPPLHPAWSGTENEAYKAGAESLVPLVLELTDALREISEKEGMCIFGSSDTSNLPEVAFRQGSAYSYSECARTSKKALQAIDGFLVDEK